MSVNTKGGGFGDTGIKLKIRRGMSIWIRT